MGDKRRKMLGDLGERLAAGKLEALGYKLIETNWRCEIGELDAVAWHEQCLVFIEVRTRRGNGAGSPEDSLTVVKQQRLQRLVEAYLDSHSALLDERGQFPPCRIDLAAVEFSVDGRLLRLQIRQNVIE
jgi:putative endonuclease